MKRLPTLLLTVTFALAAIHGARGQEEYHGNYGSRYIRWFSDENIRIGQKQVWGIREGVSDFMFLAINDGLAMYDGMRWRIYQTPEKSVIRALHWDNASERLYSSGVNEFGYWTLDNFGEMRYTRLFHNERFRELSYDFWRIAFPAGSDSVMFQSHGIIFAYNTVSESLSSIEPSHSFAYMHAVGNRIYVQDGRLLFLIREDGERKKICELDSRVINMFADDAGVLLLAIEHLGIFRFDGERLSPVDPHTNAMLSSAKITSCEQYGKMLLVGTTRGGLFVLDAEGQIVEGFCRDDELSNATVLSLGVDSEGNIWLGMDAGVAMIDNSSDEYYLLAGEMGQVQAVVPYGEGLVAGTNKGLFVLSARGTIEPVAGSQGMVWKLIRIGEAIFVLHDQGLFLFESGVMTPIRREGIMNMVQLHNDKRFFVAGDYNGLSLYETVDGKLDFVNTIKNYGGYARNFFIDRNDNIWLPIRGVGFVRLTLSDDKTHIAETRHFDIDFSGADKMVLCTLIDGEPVLYADGKAYVVNYIKDTLEYNPSFTELLGMCGAGLAVCTQIGNRFWYISEGDVGYIERSPGGVLTKFPELFGNIYDRRLTSHFFRVNGMTAIGFHNGIGLITSGRNTASRLQIGMIEAYGTKETMLYDRSKASFDIPATMNNIRIYPVRPGKSRVIEYRIDGLYDDWTPVEVDDCIQLVSLPSGDYTVRLRQGGGTGAGHSPSGDTVSFRIRVAGPWYFSAVAIACYMLIVLALSILVRSYYHRKNRKAGERIRQIEQEKRIRELEELEKENLLKEKRITELETERLRSDIRDKDKRLANLTMNSMKRNGMLGELRQEITDLMGLDNVGKVKISLARVVRRINTQMNNDEDWPLAEKYFNTIYDGLLDRLRAARPNLSQTDLKLCVYIKLNLSTKEIAEIMNISPRSVEMARYRLRKKLNLKPDESIGNVLK